MGQVYQQMRVVDGKLEFTASDTRPKEYCTNAKAKPVAEDFRLPPWARKPAPPTERPALDELDEMEPLPTFEEQEELTA